MRTAFSIMRMRTVIETGRKTSPAINRALDELKDQIDAFSQILSDFSSVKSECGRYALLVQCADGLEHLSRTFDAVGSEWVRFDRALGDYKYQFDRRKKDRPVDLPGQQIMDL